MECVEPEKLDSSSKGRLKGPMVITGPGAKTNKQMNRETLKEGKNGETGRNNKRNG